MEKLIKKYLETKNPDTLHKMRVLARKTLSKLAIENKTDLYLKKLMKLSSKIRDSDVMLEKCKHKKIKNYLLKIKRKKLKRFLKFLKDYHSEIVEIKKNKISLKKCKKICKKNFLKLNNKKLHKIRIEIKKCRYSLKMNELKLLQTMLGEVHDLENCIKLMKKFHFNIQQIEKLKLKYIKKANKEKNKICKSTLLN